MARIPLITTVGPKPWQVKQGVVAVELGAVQSNDPSVINATRASVGLTDSNVEFNPNIEVAMLSSDQLFNPHGVVETAWAYQVTMSLDESNIWNLCLAMSYDQDAVTASSLLSYDAQQPSSYRCMRMISEGAKATADAAEITENTDLYKVKVVSNGAIVRGRNNKTTIPIIIHAVCNSSDVVGNTGISVAAGTAPAYE